MSFYIKIDGLNGSATAQNHQGWMQLESLDFGTHRDIHVQPGRTSTDSDPYLVYTLNNVILNHYDISGSSPKSTDMLMETLFLNFTQAQMKFVPRDSSNNAQNPIIAGFDLEKTTKM